MTSLHRHLTDFDRKRHDHTEILTRIDVSQILNVLENCSKHSNDSSLRVSFYWVFSISEFLKEVHLVNELKHVLADL